MAIKRLSPRRAPVFPQGVPAARAAGTSKDEPEERHGAPVERDHYYQAIALLRDIHEGRRHAADLSTGQRRACVALLMNGKHTSHEIAAILHVSTRTIGQDLRKIRAEMGAEVKEWTVDEVVGQMVLAADRYQAMAIEGKDVALAWTIQRDLVKSLRELGVLKGEERDGGLRITIEAMSAGYEQARDKLAQALDPRLTGEVIDTTAEVMGDRAPRLPMAFPDQPDEDPGVEVESE